MSSSFAFNFLGGDSSENSSNNDIIEKNQQQKKHIISNNNNLPTGSIEEEEEEGGSQIIFKKSASSSSSSPSPSSFSWIDNTSIISNYLDCIKKSNCDDSEEERPPTYLTTQQQPYDYDYHYDIIPITSDISLKAVKQQQQQQPRRQRKKEEGGDNKEEEEEEEKDYLTSYDYYNNNSKSDLIPGIYEGGLKVWECSIDLCRYIMIATTTATEINLDGNSNVLELGCGHGLPGCLILLLLMKQQQQQTKQQTNNFSKTTTSSCDGGGGDGGGVVVFSDYNEFVLKDVTSINIALNLLLTSSSSSSSATTTAATTNTKSTSSVDIEDKQEIANWIVNHTILGAGDWNEMSKNLIVDENGTTENTEKNECEDYHNTLLLLPKDGQFDYIFAAETTYTESAAHETANIIVKHLKVGTGIAFVATKRYYFGVGGGSDALRERITTINNNNNNSNNHNATTNNSHHQTSDDDNNVETTTTATTSKSCYYYNVETVQVYDDGSSNIREILKITSSLSKGIVSDMTEVG